MAKLNEKHLKCLELLKQNKYSIPEIAEIVKFNKDHIHDLINGNTRRAGTIAEIFQSEYEKISPIVDNRTSRKGSRLREKTIDKLLMWVVGIKDSRNLGKEGRKTLIDIINALKTVSPLSIETNIYKTGLSEEDLVNEFKRLKSLARAAIERGRVQKSLEGREGKVSLLSPEGTGEAEGSQDLDLPSIPETEEVPPEQSND